MKIIIPFDEDTFFSPEQHSLIRLLKLDDRMVLDQVLDNWTIYIGGDVEDVYERTVDDLHDLIDHTYGDSDEGIQMQIFLGEHQNELVELMRHAAIQLQYVLAGMPEKAREMTYETGEYHFLKVEEINYPGKFAVIVTDVRDNVY